MQAHIVDPSALKASELLREPSNETVRVLKALKAAGVRIELQTEFESLQLVAQRVLKVLVIEADSFDAAGIDVLELHADLISGWLKVLVEP